MFTEQNFYVYTLVRNSFKHFAIVSSANENINNLCFFLKYIKSLRLLALKIPKRDTDNNKSSVSIVATSVQSES